MDIDEEYDKEEVAIVYNLSTALLIAVRWVQDKFEPKDLVLYRG